MKKILLGVSLFLSAGLSAEMVLETKYDSLNYAFGYANAEGMIEQVLGKDSVNVEDRREFAEGFVLTFDSLSGDRKLYADAAYFYLSLSKYIDNGGILGDSTIGYDVKMFGKEFKNAMMGKKTKMGFDESADYINSVMSNPLDSGVVRSEGQVDSMNLAFAVANASTAKMQVMGADTTEKDVKMFMKHYGKIVKLKKQNKYYFEGIAIGRAMYSQVKKAPYLMGDETVVVSYGLIREAIRARVMGDQGLMTGDAVKMMLNDYLADRGARQSEQHIIENAKFLERNAKEPGMTVTKSGLQYYVNRMGEGEMPTATSVVKVHYTGYLLDGTKFDSSIDRGAPIEFPLTNVIKGWTEGVQLMPVGSKFTFFIPFHLAYGERGIEGAIPPYATLMFEIELLDIVK